jgi:hypothetical protein
MDPTLITAVLSPAMAVVLFLNILVGAGATLAAGGNLGPFKLSPTLATYLAPVFAILSGAVAFNTKQASAAGSSFSFSVMLVVTALLVGAAMWLASAQAGKAVEHTARNRMAAKMRVARVVPPPAS